jgi:hypothetical protein
MNTNQPFAIGQTVRPAHDGETHNGRIIYWTRIRGTVVDIWPENEDTNNPTWRVQVRWEPSVGRAYATRLTADWLSSVQ